MVKRKSISKKLRFDIFKRDDFQCQYCGSTPPSVVLEIDHIQPVSKGGNNDIDNLISACFDCNRGKSAIPLDVVPTTLAKKAKGAIEAEEQLKEYLKIKKRILRRVSIDAEKVSKSFEKYFEGISLSESSINTIKQRFLPNIDVLTLIDSMDFACSRLQYDEPDEAYRYFCGMCWNMIRENNHG